jgi:hypothetical protein
MAKKEISKVFILSVLFFAVLYGIWTLNAPGFQKSPSIASLEIFVAAGLRPFNWCPENVQIAEVISKDGAIIKKIELLREVSALCKIMIGSVKKDHLEASHFKNKIKSYSISRNQINYLEQSEDKKLFRVKGLVFSSKMLEEVLERSL